MDKRKEKCYFWIPELNQCTLGYRREDNISCSECNNFTENWELLRKVSPRDPRLRPPLVEKVHKALDIEVPRE